MPTLELHQLLDVHVTWKYFKEPLRFFAVSKDNKRSDTKKHMHVFSLLLDASHGRVHAKSVCTRSCEDGSQHKTNLGRRRIQKEVDMTFAMPVCA